jgi:hypothetical protein
MMLGLLPSRWAVASCSRRGRVGRSVGGCRNGSVEEGGRCETFGTLFHVFVSLLDTNLFEGSMNWTILTTWKNVKTGVADSSRFGTTEEYYYYLLEDPDR